MLAALNFSSPRQQLILYLLTVACGLAAVLVFFGAVPFVGISTLGQGLGSTVGFAQSLLNDPAWSPYATNFGYPTPMPRSFGLSGVLVTEAFLWMGAEPWNAYSLMLALYVSMAFLGAVRLARFWRVGPKTSVLMSVVWLALPVTWNHHSYSMLSIGFALLPLYFWASCQVLFPTDHSVRGNLAKALLLVGVCTLSVMTDGYTFMMFAVGTGLLGIYVFFAFPERRLQCLIYSGPVVAFGMGLAYILYKSYVNSLDFTPSSIGFFRGWGADVAFFVQPTKGVHLLWDFLGLSSFRSSSQYFGDASVWMTTFSIPLVAAAVLAFLLGKANRRLTLAFLLVGLVGFYMSLGPSLKVYSTKPTDQEVGAMMPSEYAIAPTGSSVLSSNLPGFKSMRASYRWVGLGLLGFWVILVLGIASMQKNGYLGMPVLLGVGLVLAFMPNPASVVGRAVSYKQQAEAMSEALIEPMKADTRSGELVAFLPYQNDIGINYIAPTLGVTAYNVGGDKNVEMAKQNWPPEMLRFKPGAIHSDFSQDIVELLESGAVNAVVLPYFDTLWAIHRWPTISKHESHLRQISANLKERKYLSVVEREWYSIIRLSQEGMLSGSSTIGRLAAKANYPYDPSGESGAAPISELLLHGWHEVEPKLVWSGRVSALRLPVPESCGELSCEAELTFVPFAASESRVVEVTVQTAQGKQAERLVLTDGRLKTVNVSLPSDKEYVVVEIMVPTAVSPKRLGLSADVRTLGIALREVRLNTK